jgi:5-methylcytosine-specific restriction endonuclease McrA
MPKAPRQHRPAHWVPPAVRRKEIDARRKPASERGYNTTWHKFSAAIKSERLFCELCLTIGKETPIVGDGVTDHIIAMLGPDDPLFLDPAAVWALCVSCDRWKSIHFDGTYGGPKLVATDRTLAGIEQRRREIIDKFKAEQARRI